MINSLARWVWEMPEAQCFWHVHGQSRKTVVLHVCFNMMQLNHCYVDHGTLNPVQTDVQIQFKHHCYVCWSLVCFNSDPVQVWWLLQITLLFFIFGVWFLRRRSSIRVNAMALVTSHFEKQIRSFDHQVPPSLPDARRWHYVWENWDQEKEGDSQHRLPGTMSFGKMVLMISSFVPGKYFQNLDNLLVGVSTNSFEQKSCTVF